MGDKTKTMGCIGSVLLILITGAVVSLVQLARMAGAEQYFWAFMAVACITVLAVTVSSLADHPPTTGSPSDE